MLYLVSTSSPRLYGFREAAARQFFFFVLRLTFVFPRFFMTFGPPPLISVAPLFAPPPPPPVCTFHLQFTFLPFGQVFSPHTHTETHTHTHRARHQSGRCLVFRSFGHAPVFVPFPQLLSVRFSASLCCRRAGEAAEETAAGRRTQAAGCWMLLPNPRRDLPFNCAASCQKRNE